MHLRAARADPSPLAPRFESSRYDGKSNLHTTTTGERRLLITGKGAEWVNGITKERMRQSTLHFRIDVHAMNPQLDCRTSPHLISPTESLLRNPDQLRTHFTFDLASSLPVALVLSIAPDGS